MEIIFYFLISLISWGDMSNALQFFYPLTEKQKSINASGQNYTMFAVKKKGSLLVVLDPLGSNGFRYHSVRVAPFFYKKKAFDVIMKRDKFPSIDDYIFLSPTVHGYLVLYRYDDIYWNCKRAVSVNVDTRKAEEFFKKPYLLITMYISEKDVDGSFEIMVYLQKVGNTPLYFPVRGIKKWKPELTKKELDDIDKVFGL